MTPLPILEAPQLEQQNITNGMHAIFRKFGKRSAHAKWVSFRSEVENKVSGLQNAFVTAVEHDRLVATHRKKFFAQPTVENLASWRAAVAERQAAREVSQEIISTLQERRKECMGGGRPLLLEVIEEGEAEVKMRVKQIQEEDVQRTQEIGEPFSSSGPLVSLTGKLELFRRARAILPSDVTAARGFVGTALETEI